MKTRPFSSVTKFCTILGNESTGATRVIRVLGEIIRLLMRMRVFGPARLLAYFDYEARRLWWLGLLGLFELFALLGIGAIGRVFTEFQ